MFKHPKYYKELRKLRNKLDQAISSCSNSTELAQRAPGPGLKLQATSSKLQAPSESSNKPQASSPKQKGSSFKPQASSAKIPEPGNNWKRLTALGPRASTKINVLLGCLTCHAIWCGENLIFIPLVTFNSTVKKVYQIYRGLDLKILAYPALLIYWAIIILATFSL